VAIEQSPPFQAKNLMKKFLTKVKVGNLLQYIHAYVNQKIVLVTHTYFLNC